MHIHFNNNPKYKDESSWGRGDCVIRAISCAMNWTWQESYIWCVLHSMTVCDLPNTLEGFRHIMKDLGFERTILDDKYKVNVKTFCEQHKKGIYILSVEGLTGHVVCCKDGDWYDAFDSGQFLVYGYNKLINPIYKRRKLPLILRIRLHIRKVIRKLKKHK